jgi:hypothetical protein
MKLKIRTSYTLRFLLLVLSLDACQTIPQKRGPTWTFIPFPSDRGSLAHSQCGVIDGKLVAFGGVDDTKASPLNNQLLFFDPEASRWQFVQDETSPSARNYAAFSVFQDAVLVLGGETAQQNASADAHIYRANGHWEALPQIDTLIPRKQATLTQLGSELVLFGGQGPATVTNWAHYDMKNKTWHVELSKPEMEARVSHIAVGLSESSVLVWGGFIGQERRGDGFILDIKSHEVIRIPPGPYLAARANARAVRLGDEVLIWGGASSDGNSNSGAGFHLTSRQWQSLPSIPDARFNRLKGSEIAPLGNKGFLLFGGRFGSEEFNDQLWFFDAALRKWSIIRTDETPEGRLAHCFVRLSPQRFAVFGGIGHDRDSRHLRQFNGVWILDL